MNLSICSYQKPESITISIDNSTDIFTKSFEEKKFAENVSKEFELLLKTHSLSLNNLNMISIITGPGSYTGLRCGFGFAKGLAQGIELKLGQKVNLFGVDYFDLMKYKLLESTGAKDANIENYLILQDARNDRYFYKKDNSISIITKEEILSMKNEDLHLVSDKEIKIDMIKNINLEINSEDLNHYILENINNLKNHNTTVESFLEFLPEYVLEPRIG